MQPTIIVRSGKTRARQIGRFLEQRYSVVRYDSLTHGLAVFGFRGMSAALEAAPKVEREFTGLRVAVALNDRFQTPQGYKTQFATSRIPTESWTRVRIAAALRLHLRNVKIVEVNESEKQLSLAPADPPRPTLLHWSKSLPLGGFGDCRQIKVHELWKNNGRISLLPFELAREGLALALTAGRNHVRAELINAPGRYHGLSCAIRTIKRAAGGARILGLGYGVSDIATLDGTADDNAHLQLVMLAGRPTPRTYKDFELAWPGVGVFSCRVLQFTPRMPSHSVAPGEWDQLGFGQPQFPERAVRAATGGPHGSFGAVVRHQGQFFGITCGHVLWRSSILQYFGRPGHFATHAKVHETIALNPLEVRHDLSQMPWDSETCPADIALFGPLRGKPASVAVVEQPFTNPGQLLNKPVLLDGATTNAGRSFVRGVFSLFEVPRGRWHYRKREPIYLKRVLACDGFTRGGDSGAVIRDANSGQAVSIHTGLFPLQLGSDNYEKDYSISQDLEALFASLNEK